MFVTVDCCWKSRRTTHLCVCRRTIPLMCLSFIRPLFTPPLYRRDKATTRTTTTTTTTTTMSHFQLVQQQPHPNNGRSRRRQVCLFGLSADPPTGRGGHLGIVNYLASSSSSSSFSFDEVRILPVYRHMYSTKRNNQTPFHHRVHMCKLNFENDVNDDNVDSSSHKEAVVVVSEAERICFERHVETNNHL